MESSWCHRTNSKIPFICSVTIFLGSYNQTFFFKPLQDGRWGRFGAGIPACIEFHLPKSLAQFFTGQGRGARPKDGLAGIGESKSHGVRHLLINEPPQTCDCFPHLRNSFLDGFPVINQDLQEEK